MLPNVDDPELHAIGFQRLRCKRNFVTIVSKYVRCVCVSRTYYNLNADDIGYDIDNRCFYSMCWDLWSAYLVSWQCPRAKNVFL